MGTINEIILGAVGVFAVCVLLAFLEFELKDKIISNMFKKGNSWKEISDELEKRGL